MLNKIAGTAGAKILTAVLGFVIISMNANLLGAAAVGTIALLILGITISMLFSSLGGGAALVYMVPRESTWSLYVPATTWTILTAAIVVPLLGWLSWLPAEFLWQVFILSALRGISNNHSTILLGKEKIKESNWLAVVEIIVLLLAVFFIYFVKENQSVDAYVWALIIAYASNSALGLWLIRKFLVEKSEVESSFYSAFSKTIRYSFFIQSASFFQLMNYRLGYYFLEFFSGRSSLGIYSVGIRLSESIWIIGKSVSTVQYARISNTSNLTYARDLSALFFKIIFAITLLLIIVLLALPENLYLWIFSAEFEGIKAVMIYVSPGILNLACSMAFSGFFSGIGKQHINTIGSFIGMGITIAGAFILIPKYGINGAAITASLSYTATTLYYFLLFLKVGKTGPGIFLPNRDDLEKIRAIALKKA